MKKYFSLVLFAHSIFALPFAIIGFFLAIYTTDANFTLLLFILMLCCMVFARNAAMAFNRYLDRDIDAMNPRTAMRDIPAGKISASQALTFTLLNCALFIATTWFINPLCFYLSPIALAVVLGYSYTKKFTALCHIVLGIGLGLAPLGAYLAVTGTFNIVPVFYSLAVIFWVSGFDIIYALQDEEFDKDHELNSIPAFFGTKNALHISEIFHILSAIFITLPIFYLDLGWLYYIGVLFYILLLIYQHIIISPTDLRRVNKAFMTTNGIASVIFALFFLLDIWF
ncbi:UbiA-like polyprenyltransferase [Albibacterium bauzanense]|uniref:4-hydroxybenzoate polyprenyltransferase n=1 Tax=Albibacterium bauzanense TaxID=653929 RepID=A0A4R1LVS7_9SPHI|nr:UbiA-like polyprenyltransferase [Albibacterium bauzanense]TCK83536.1 4-hydroxybenzoate polyprenyltransferase [Albibacterium bauzanense]